MSTNTIIEIIVGKKNSFTYPHAKWKHVCQVMESVLMSKGANTHVLFDVSLPALLHQENNSPQKTATMY